MYYIILFMFLYRIFILFIKHLSTNSYQCKYFLLLRFTCSVVYRIYLVQLVIL